MKTYLTVYLGAAVLAIMTTPIVIRIAKRLNILDAPDVRKVHSKPIPRIGGVAIFVSMMALTLPVLFLQNPIGDSFRLVQSKIVALLVAAGFVFIVGLVDDIRGLPVRAKFLAQLVAALVVCHAGIRIPGVTVTESLVINFGWLSWPITILWIVGISNAINLIDGLDGLAAGICAATCGVIVILSFYFGPPVMTVMMLSLMGALTGFLFYNFSPAKIFMGDSGSLFLGFIIASSSVLCAAKAETLVGLALPTLTLGIPIFDTLLSMLRRFLERRSMFAPDRSHFHHQLLALGFRQRHAVMIAYAVTLLAAGLGMFMLVTRNAETVVVFVCILFLLVLAFRIVGSVRLRETMAALKKKHSISSEKKREMEDFQQVELHFRQAENFDHWWRAVSTAADKMGVLNLSLHLMNRDGTPKELTWRHESWTPNSDNDLLKASFPVADRRSGPPLK
ncbi:MAG TPA: undecaprenyl/decaprenyl-phosphate alpha-N-acetylglucosaminyl 1-phosphate transferase, partial [Phycisphaerales bacterium]|nr:undecaprenyl/decaprenyl-phosphate alpha-N-acetylglucosaminyl 1-phosphate transferase [Phycisphaerales bacterium]